MKITDIITEAKSAHPQQAAKAIAMKKAGKKPRQGVAEAVAPSQYAKLYHSTPAINLDGILQSGYLAPTGKGYLSLTRDSKLDYGSWGGEFVEFDIDQNAVRQRIKLEPYVDPTTQTGARAAGRGESEERTTQKIPLKGFVTAMHAPTGWEGDKAGEYYGGLLKKYGVPIIYDIVPKLEEQGVAEGVADMHSNELLNTVRGAIRKAIKETGDQSLSKIFVCLRNARPASEALKNITSPNSLAEVDNALQEVGIDFDDLLDFINKQAEKYGGQGVAEGSLNEFSMGDDGEDPTDNYPCYDCGSTIFLHHTKLCDLAEDNAIRDLPAKPGSQHWTGQIPKGLNPIPGLQEGVAESKELAEEFDLIESIVEQIAEHNGVDAEAVWADLESLTEDELYVFAVTSDPLMESEAWQKANKRDKTDGMSQKAVNTYRREHPGSKLKTAVTTKPSKLKKGSKDSKRRKSYCSRSRGQMKMHSISCAKTPDKAICKARRRWNC